MFTLAKRARVSDIVCVQDSELNCEELSSNAWSLERACEPRVVENAG